ncbi:right-handed parallel beta-helix repeat-containing protein [Candidatus Acetothermia bacterium]|nr:right-handed parallel beta-helix repeat-containing protein [Candidatus Acetothermia bacterium]MBI3356549.1 right-handed parallel beta-helix repeat-containing protein [Nitrospirota bacterium]
MGSLPRSIRIIIISAVVLSGLPSGLDLRGAEVRTVCASGGDFTKIQEAVQAAAPGDTISVCPGEYKERVVIQKSVTLSGAGPTDVRILGGIVVAGVDLLVNLGGFTVAGGFNGIDVRGQTVGLIRNVVVTKNAADGISVLDASRVSLFNAIITENGTSRPPLEPIGSGLYIGGNARVSLALSTLSKNIVDGITLNDRGSLEASVLTEISENGKDGVAVCGASQVSLQGVLISGHAGGATTGGNGVFVADRGQAMIAGVTLTKNKRSGIQVGGFCGAGIGGAPAVGVARATITHSTVTNNGGHGISVGSLLTSPLPGNEVEADVQAFLNRIEGNGKCGIWVDSDARVDERDNLFSGNPGGDKCK